MRERGAQHNIERAREREREREREMHNITLVTSSFENIIKDYPEHHTTQFHCLCSIYNSLIFVYMLKDEIVNEISMTNLKV